MLWSLAQTLQKCCKAWRGLALQGNARTQKHEIPVIELASQVDRDTDTTPVRTWLWKPGKVPKEGCGAFEFVRERLVRDTM